MVLDPIPFVPMAGLEAMDEMGRFFNKTFDLIVYPMFSIFYHTIFQRNPKPLRFSVKA